MTHGDRKRLAEKQNSTIQRGSYHFLTCLRLVWLHCCAPKFNNMHLSNKSVASISKCPLENNHMITESCWLFCFRSTKTVTLRIIKNFTKLVMFEVQPSRWCVMKICNQHKMNLQLLVNWLNDNGSIYNDSLIIEKLCCSLLLGDNKLHNRCWTVGVTKTAMSFSLNEEITPDSQFYSFQHWLFFHSMFIRCISTVAQGDPSALPYSPHMHGRHSESLKLCPHTRGTRCLARLATLRPGAWRTRDCQSTEEATPAPAWSNLTAKTSSGNRGTPNDADG